MILFQVTLLSSLLLSSVSSLPVLEIYKPLEHKRIYFENRQFIEENYTGLSKSEDNHSTIRSCLQLPVDFDVENIKHPDDIEGVSEDIPYNYHANINQSAKILYSMIYQGWEIEYYLAAADSIKVNLVKEDEKCRIVIFEDSIKVYQKSDL